MEFKRVGGKGLPGNSETQKMKESRATVSSSSWKKLCPRKTKPSVDRDHRAMVHTSAARKT